MIYLVRHGETDSNVGGQLQGHLDVPLNKDTLMPKKCETFFVIPAKAGIGLKTTGEAGQ